MCGTAFDTRGDGELVMVSKAEVTLVVFSDRPLFSLWSYAVWPWGSPAYSEFISQADRDAVWLELVSGRSA